jgi:hypothetical protein
MGRRLRIAPMRGRVARRRTCDTPHNRADRSFRRPPTGHDGHDLPTILSQGSATSTRSMRAAPSTEGTHDRAGDQNPTPGEVDHARRDRVDGPGVP